MCQIKNKRYSPVQIRRDNKNQRIDSNFLKSYLHKHLKTIANLKNYLPSSYLKLFTISWLNNGLFCLKSNFSGYYLRVFIWINYSENLYIAK